MINPSPTEKRTDIADQDGSYTGKSLMTSFLLRDVQSLDVT
jgi:hypothetical protein